MRRAEVARRHLGDERRQPSSGCVELGWRTPDESKREFATVTPNFDMYVALTAAPTLAELLVGQPRAASDAAPGDLVLQTSR